MTRNGWGSAPEDNRNCSRDAAPHGGSSGGLPWRVTVLALVVCLALAACSSSQGVSGQTPVNSTTSGPRITVAMVTHGQAADPFWALVKDGAQTAAKAFNVNLVYSSPATTNPQEQASLITKAAAQHPKGLVVTIPDAAVLSAPIKQAASSGIPVIVMNVGANVYQNVGGLTFVGQDEIGRRAGGRPGDGRPRRAQGAVRHPRGAEHRPGPAVRRVHPGAGGQGRLGHDHPRQRGPAQLGGHRDRERAEGRPVHRRGAHRRHPGVPGSRRGAAEPGQVRHDQARHLRRLDPGPERGQQRPGAVRHRPAAVPGGVHGGSGHRVRGAVRRAPVRADPDRAEPDHQGQRGAGPAALQEHRRRAVQRRLPAS